jgi:hypothetical protein
MSYKGGEGLPRSEFIESVSGLIAVDRDRVSQMGSEELLDCYGRVGSITDQIIEARPPTASFQDKLQSYRQLLGFLRGEATGRQIGVESLDFDFYQADVTRHVAVEGLMCWLKLQTKRHGIEYQPAGLVEVPRQAAAEKPLAVVVAETEVEVEVEDVPPISITKPVSSQLITITDALAPLSEPKFLDSFQVFEASLSVGEVPTEGPADQPLTDEQLLALLSNIPSLKDVECYRYVVSEDNDHVVEKSEDWGRGALCSQIDPDLFFPEVGEPNETAKWICSHCDVQQQCLEYILGPGKKFGLYGIWGGLSWRDRRAIKGSPAG